MHPKKVIRSQKIASCANHCRSPLFLSSGLLLEVSFDEFATANDPVRRTQLFFADIFQSERTLKADFFQESEHRFEIGLTHAEGDRETFVCMVTHMHAAEKGSISKDLLGWRVPECEAISYIVARTHKRMLNGVKKLGELGGCQIRFEVQLDASVFRSRRDFLEDKDEGFELDLPGNGGAVDKRKNDMASTQEFRAIEKRFEFLDRSMGRPSVGVSQNMRLKIIRVNGTDRQLSRFHELADR